MQAIQQPTAAGLATSPIPDSGASGGRRSRVQFLRRGLIPPTFAFLPGCGTLVLNSSCKAHPAVAIRDSSPHTRQHTPARYVAEVQWVDYTQPARPHPRQQQPSNSASCHHPHRKQHTQPERTTAQHRPHHDVGFVRGGVNRSEQRFPAVQLNSGGSQLTRQGFDGQPRFPVARSLIVHPLFAGLQDRFRFVFIVQPSRRQFGPQFNQLFSGLRDSHNAPGAAGRRHLGHRPANRIARDAQTLTGDSPAGQTVFVGRTHTPDSGDGRGEK